MGDINSVEKICGFYVSGIHLVTMILPYLKNKIRENVKIETILEYSLKKEVNNVMDNLTIKEKEKEKILNIDWNSSKIQKYSNVEKKLSSTLEDNNIINILISGTKKYIEEINKIIDKFINKNINKIRKKKISVINCYEMTEFDDNIREILDKHNLIINTSGVHKIEDIFEDYKKINYGNEA